MTEEKAKTELSLCRYLVHFIECAASEIHHTSTGCEDDRFLYNYRKGRRDFAEDLIFDIQRDAFSGFGAFDPVKDKEMIAAEKKEKATPADNFEISQEKMVHRVFELLSPTTLQPDASILMPRVTLMTLLEEARKGAFDV